LKKRQKIWKRQKSWKSDKKVEKVLKWNEVERKQLFQLFCRWRSFTNAKISTPSFWGIYVEEEYNYDFCQSIIFCRFRWLQTNVRQ
jgi:hypothetical protein